jgi:hypothetical protein
MARFCHADRLDALEIGADGEVLIGLTTILQIGELGGRQRQLLGERDRLRPDLGRHPLEPGLDRHAGFHADQQQVERVREGAPDRKLAMLDAVLEEQARHVHAQIGGGETNSHLYHRGLVESISMRKNR